VFCIAIKPSVFKVRSRKQTTCYSRTSASRLHYNTAYQNRIPVCTNICVRNFENVLYVHLIIIGYKHNVYETSVMKEHHILSQMFVWHDFVSHITTDNYSNTCKKGTDKTNWDIATGNHLIIRILHSVIQNLEVKICVV